MTPSPSSTIGPLNPGNVVSAALRLYRDHFKTYIGLSAIAILWAFVPIYGWAKYSMYTGILSRLAFRELINEPETPEQARRQLTPKLWSFLGLAALVVLIFFGAFMALYLGGIIGGMLVGFGLGAVFSGLFGEAGTIIAGIIGVILFLGVFLFGLLWVIGRFFIAEVPMSIETRTGATDSIGRSWNLTKQSIIRIQFVVLAAYLITIPVASILSFAPQIALIFLEPGSSAYWTLYVITLALSFVVNVLLMPFWQAVKGVLYYDLRSRREGLDLQI